MIPTKYLSVSFLIFFNPQNINKIVFLTVNFTTKTQKNSLQIFKKSKHQKFAGRKISKKSIFGRFFWFFNFSLRTENYTSPYSAILKSSLPPLSLLLTLIPTIPSPPQTTETSPAVPETPRTTQEEQIKRQQQQR